METDSLIPIGTVGAAHGLRGEVRLHLFNPASETIRTGLPVVLRGRGSFRQTRVASTRGTTRGLLVRFEGVVDRDSAMALTGCEVAVKRGDLAPLRPGEFYYHDVIGLPARMRDGREVGRIASVMSGATDILVIQGREGEVLVPVVEGFVAEIRPDEVLLEEGAME